MISKITAVVSTVSTTAIYSTSTVLANLKELTQHLYGSLPNFLEFTAVIISLNCLRYMVTTPWTNYFSAKSSRLQLEKNKENHIKVVEQDLVDATKYEKWLLVYAVGLHLAGAAGVCAFAKLTGEKFFKPHLAFIFLGTMLLRPAQASHAHVQRRLFDINKNVVYPDAEIVLLREKLREIQQVAVANQKALKLIDRETFKHIEEDYWAVADKFSVLKNGCGEDRNQDSRKEQKAKQELENASQSITRDATSFGSQQRALIERQTKETTRQYETLMRTIDDSVHSLNDEMQMVSGMKQFLSLVRENLYEAGTSSNTSVTPQFVQSLPYNEKQSI